MFKSIIFKLLKKKKFKSNFSDLLYSPRWVIYFIDIAIVFLSSLISMIFFRNLSLDSIDSNFIIEYFSLLFFINSFFFWIFNTYSCVIRYSSYLDVFRILGAQFFSFSSLLFINWILIFWFNTKLFLFISLIVSFMLSSGFLFLYRLLIRKIYEDLFLENSSDGKSKTLIYGSDTNAIVIANALKFETPNRFNLIGFIGRSTDVTSKRILGLPILIIKQDLEEIIKDKDIKSIIIADRKISLKSKKEIVNSCIKLGCKVYTSPVVEDCENINQISKGIKSFEILDLLERDEIVLDCEKVSNKICSKTILITGAAGSIGSELVRQIVKFLPKKLILLDQAESQLYDLTIELSRCNKNVEIVNCVDDIRNLELISSIFEKYRPEIVYHAAAYKHVPLMEENPRQAVLTNVLGTKNVSDLSIKFNVKTFVMVSTDKAVNPTSVMGATKRIAEKYIQAKHFSGASHTTSSKTQFITTRFGNVLGSNGSVIPLFAKQIEQGGPVTITHPDIERYFMTIPEACQLVLEASAMGNGGEIFIFDMGKPIKIIDLANKMIQLAGYTPNNDIEVKCVGLRPGEKLYEELLNDSSKCLPTYNSKIMIAVEETDDYGKIETQVLALMDSFQCLSNDEIILAMKAILPNYEYFSNV